jgi:hypothetical protein
VPCMLDERVCLSGPQSDQEDALAVLQNAMPPGRTKTSQTVMGRPDLCELHMVREAVLQA